jgi:hypothetical protein
MRTEAGGARGPNRRIPNGSIADATRSASRFSNEPGNIDRTNKRIYLVATVLELFATRSPVNVWTSVFLKE